MLKDFYIKTPLKATSQKYTVYVELDFKLSIYFDQSI